MEDLNIDMDRKDENRFSMDVEVVSQALKQRSGRNSARQEGQKLYQKFLETKQEPVRLAVALRAFFLEDGVQPEEKGEYGAYLQRRFRPAVRQLIEEDGVDRLEQLKELGWFEKQGRQQLDDFLKMARELGKMGSLVWLLHLKENLCGYEDGDFEL